MNIKIYQAPTQGKYTFMDYEFAMEHNFSFEDYSKVADFDYACEEDANDMNILNQIWRIGNDGTLQKIAKMRSLSVSDIVGIEGRYYYVDSFGFKRI